MTGLHLSSSSHLGCFGRGFTSASKVPAASGAGGAKLHSTLSELAMPQDSEEQ